MLAPQIAPGHELALLRKGADFFPALVAAIDASHCEVRLETYIFHFDRSGEQVAGAMVRAAKRGVAVYLVMDGIGTPEVPGIWAAQFDAVGVHWHRFSPLGPFGLLIPGQWRRLHRKLCVVDMRIGFCGGINILDDLFDPNHGDLDSPRFDFALQVRGPLVADMHGAMVSFWDRLVFSRQLERLQFERARQMLKNTWAALPMPLTSAKPPADDRAVDAPAADAKPVGAQAMLVLRDNVQNRTRIERAYRRAIADARQEIIIANAYFLPGGKLRRALIHAARRGVRVCLLVQGRYENFMQFHASRPVLGALLAAGIEIHEYSVGFLHAKVAVVDGHWATVGSSNLDPLSLLLAREANVVVEDTTFAAELRNCLITAMQTQGVVLNSQTYANRPWRQRVLDRIAFSAMRLLLFLSGRRY